MCDVSIIIPVYNIQMRLSSCVDSVLNQAAVNIEVILVDDGSDDGSGKVCDSYALKDKRVKVIHQKNLGVTAARRNGLQLAEGEWVTFVDGDDFLPVNAISDLVNHSDGVDIVCGNVLLKRDENVELEKFPTHINEITSFTPDEFLILLFRKKRLCSLYAKLIRRSCLPDAAFSFARNVSYAEDFQANVLTAHHVRRGRDICNVVYHYNYYDGNTARSFRPTTSYIDIYDGILTNIISTDLLQANFPLQEAVIHYHFSWIIANFLETNTINTKLYSFLRSDKKHRLTRQERMVVHLSHLPSHAHRKLYWLTYGKKSNCIYRMCRK